MQFTELRRWLCWPCFAVLAQWFLFLRPEDALWLCPALWFVAGAQQPYWEFDLETARYIMPYAVVASVLLGYSLFLVGLINFVLPRCISQIVNRCAMFFLRCTLLPIARIVWWAREFFCCFMSFALSAQSCRYSRIGNGNPQDDEAMILGHAGGLVFLLSLVGCTRSHAPPDLDVQWILVAIAGLASTALAPLSITLHSGIVGFIAVLGCHMVCSLLLAKLGAGNRVGHGWRNILCCGALASMMQFVSFLFWGAMGIGGIQTFAIGGAFFGHVSYFAMMLLLSSTWTVEMLEKTSGGNRVTNIYLHLQGVMVISLSIVLFLGAVFGISTLSNTAYVVFVLWLMIKELELPMEQTGFKLLALYVLYQFVDQEAVMNMFNPTGLYI